MLPVLLLCLAAASPRPAYTNDDLDRVAPYRAETGGSSPVVARPPAPPPRPAETRTGREPYWRDEARRVRERVQALEDRAVELRQKIEERRRQKNVLPYSDPQIRRWDAQARELQDRGRTLENDLLDRARREGALPGWLR